MTMTDITKPARYTGGEWGSVTKRGAACRVALGLPDVYEVGMSNLGLAILYSILNRRTDTLCERVYTPWVDAEVKPLRTLESKRPLRDFDLAGFSLQYEMIYTNVLTMLSLAGISLRAADRDLNEPFIVGGGAGVYNVEPVADFFDFFIIGEAEEVFGEVIETFTAWKMSGRLGGRRGFLRRLLNVSGIYVPSFYEPLYSGEQFLGLKVTEPARRTIYKRVMADFDGTPTVEKPVVPYMEIVHDRAMLELFRGCSRGCRFCQAGMTYRPVRERRVETLRQIARRLIDNSGWDEISLTSLSSADYSCLSRLIDDLQEEFAGERISLSLPSLRVDSFSIGLAERVQMVRRSGLTFAPEAGTQRLRDVINKNVTEANLLEACSAAFAKGWKSVKLYFMLGLPTETDEDIAGIADLVRKVAALKRGVKVTVSVSCFVPKPWTAFQWVGQISATEFERRQALLRSLLTARAITLNWHNATLSVLEGVLARGDRRLSAVIETAWRMGAKFDGWSDLFKPEVWAQAFEACGIRPEYYSERERTLFEALPWEHTSPGVDRSYLVAEWEKSQAGELTADCRRSTCTGCGVCMNLGVNVIDYAGAEPEPFGAAIRAVQTITPTPYRAQIRKGAELAVLSHLDYMNMFMRAIKRAKLPIAWSAGFNPHMKISFASALAVGTTSDCEIVDFELTTPLREYEVARRLTSQLPKGAEIIRLKRLRGKVTAAMALVDMARYEVRLTLSDTESARAAVEEFNAAQELIFERITPKRTRELDAKKYLAEPLELNETILSLAIKIFPDGSLKPAEVLTLLQERFNFPATDAQINRVALLSGGKNLLDV